MKEILIKMLEDVVESNDDEKLDEICDCFAHTASRDCLECTNCPFNGFDNLSKLIEELKDKKLN